MSDYQNNQEEWIEVSDDRMEERVNRRLEARRKKRRISLAFYVAFCASILVIIAVAVAVGLDMFSSGVANAGLSTATDGDTNVTEIYKTESEDSETENSESEGTENSETQKPTEDTESQKQETIAKPEMLEDFLPVNPYSKPGTKLEQVNGIVVHYVGNTGSTAAQNVEYFESLAVTKDRHASSHFVIGLEGEIINCVPLNEWAYASNDRNEDTIAIETCHPDDTGKFNNDTYAALVKLVAWLMVECDLDIDDVIRHHDVTGKNCPKYYVEHESAWIDFKLDVQEYLDNNLN